jgi:hypothetical protein
MLAVLSNSGILAVLRLIDGSTSRSFSQNELHASYRTPRFRIRPKSTVKSAASSTLSASLTHAFRDYWLQGFLAD